VVLPKKVMNKGRVSVFQLFGCFLKLGCISFGGPVAHLGFFRTEFVQRRGWMTDEEYADLVALCQFLPGPASSQVGYAIGLREGGLMGGMAAWLGFTLPSAGLMIGLALGVGQLGDVSNAGWIVGLKLAAVAVVAQALWGMAAKLCPDRERALLALGAAAFLALFAGAIWQVVVIAVGGLVGGVLFRGQSESRIENTRDSAGRRWGPGWVWLVLFGGGLFGLPLWAANNQDSTLAVIDGFYRAGSLVFGGGHVVLPLLDAFTVGQGWIGADTFLAGYGAAQALPGPLFAFTSFLGTSISAGPGGIGGGVLALVATYVPSWLLLLGVLPYWEKIRRLATAQAILKGANAAVVGLLLAAFFNPIWATAVTSSDRLAFALLAFGALRYAKLPPWTLVLICGGAGAAVF
jgi:chromate transporter